MYVREAVGFRAGGRARRKHELANKTQQTHLAGDALGKAVGQLDVLLRRASPTSTTSSTTNDAAAQPRLLAPERQVQVELVRVVALLQLALAGALERVPYVAWAEALDKLAQHAACHGVFFVVSVLRVNTLWISDSGTVFGASFGLHAIVFCGCVF